MPGFEVHLLKGGTVLGHAGIHQYLVQIFVIARHLLRGSEGRRKTAIYCY